jgi:hypothetical protein
MLPLHFTPATFTRKTALGTLALISSCFLGTAALDSGLVKQGSILASLGFVTASALWLYARTRLPQFPRVHFLPAILLGWWVLNLALSAAAGGRDVYGTPFFTLSVIATASLVIIATVDDSNAPSSSTDQTRARS